MCVQCYVGPDRIQFLVSDAPAEQKISSGVRTIHLEPLDVAAVPVSKPGIVEHGLRIKELGVEFDLRTLAG